MNPWGWLVSRTPHELDVLRTLAVCVGSGCVPVLGFLLGWLVKLMRPTRRDAQAAARQTRREDWTSGRLKPTSLADLVARSVTTGEATRQEVGDLAGWVKGKGVHRDPTRDIPRLDPGASHYE